MCSGRGLLCEECWTKGTETETNFGFTDEAYKKRRRRWKEGREEVWKEVREIVSERIQ